ncbi:MAG: hypothetical protein HWD61_03885 [Parachlamydiaceae bacterium]|nr:MAG: hypothetical protein HWD61_03885 [Parachlamydiaceae bacterium]
MSALALPHLNKMPENHFNFESKIGLSPHLDNFESLMPNVNNFVIFDDLDYSGHDSINLVQTIAPVLKNHPMTHFYLVIPFMSKKAKNGVLYYIQRYQLEKQIHLITTDRSIVSMQEHFSKEEVLNLIKFDSVHDIQMRDWHAEYFQSGASRVREEQIPDRALSVSEWYISEHEVPETLKYRRSPDYKEKCRFMTHFAPPYMDENQGLDRPFVASFDEF